MQHTTQPLILQSAAPVAAPGMGLVQDYGLTGLLLVMVVEKGLGWWRQRGDTQQGLVTTLVADLRASNQQLTDKFFELHSQQHADMAELLGELRALGGRIDKLL